MPNIKRGLQAIEQEIDAEEFDFKKTPLHKQLIAPLLGLLSRLTVLSDLLVAPNQPPISQVQALTAGTSQPIYTALARVAIRITGVGTDAANASNVTVSISHPNVRASDATVYRAKFAAGGGFVAPGQEFVLPREGQLTLLSDQSADVILSATVRALPDGNILEQYRVM